MATVTYNWPAVLAGGATAPTALQALGVNTVIAQVVFDATDTTAVVTHNFNFSAADLAAGFPQIDTVITVLGTVAPLLSVQPNTSANTITLTKTNLANSGCTILVYITRPHTITR